MAALVRPQEANGRHDQRELAKLGCMRASWARASQNALSTVVKLWSAKIMAYLLATRRSAQHVDVLEEARHMPIHTGGGGAFTHLYRTCAPPPVHVNATRTH